MEVILAGYNVDQDLLARLKSSAPETSSDPGRIPAIDPDALTPEALSAAYARISRDPRPIPELRARAREDVARARRSNRQIIFGFGHASVAEHAVFNFDVLGLSRLAVEALEATRLGSYTEKSQRYILLDRDFVVPQEIAGGALEARFRKLLNYQQQSYRQAYDALVAQYRATRGATWDDPCVREPLEGAAKEDARYCLGLATTGQLGATLNARCLEATVQRLAADPLAEARELSARLHAAVADIAPSLVRHVTPTPYRAQTGCVLRELLTATGPLAATPSSQAPDVRLIALSPDGEEDVLAALVHGCSTLSHVEALERVRGLRPDQRVTLITESLRRLGAHEVPLRAFELAEVAYELTVSASCFAQLKRHRMATLLPQAYDPQLGFTVPPAFAECGLEARLRDVCAASEALYAEISAVAPAAAPYALTNAHRRRVLFKANARELYHFARLRLDPHAQWDIRGIAEQMLALAREHWPNLMMLAVGGQDRVRCDENASESDAPTP